MTYNLTQYLLRKFYHWLIYKVQILDRDEVVCYAQEEVFAELRIATNLSPFYFTIRECKGGSRFTRSFTVELEVPPEGSMTLQSVNEKKVLVVKIMAFYHNREVLSDLLISIALNEFIRYIRDDI